MKLFWKYIGPYKKFVIAAFFCIVTDAACELYLPILMSDIVGKGLEAGNLGYILRIGLIMAGLALVALLAGIGNAATSSRAGAGFGTALRKALFGKVQGFSFNNIDHFSTASLSTRLTNDVTQIQNTVVMGMRMIIRVPIMLTFALIMAISLNPTLAQIFFVTVPLLIVAVLIIAPKALPMFTSMQRRVDNVNRTVQENVTNVRVVKSFVREDVEVKKFNDASGDLMNTSIRAMNLVVTVSPIMMLLMNASIAAVLYFGGNQVIAGIGDAAQLTAFINYIMHVLMSLMMAAMLMVMLTRASASFKRVGEVLNTESDITEKPDAVQRSLRGELAFSDVSFKYNSGDKEYILKDISFEAKPGQVVAILGGTGSGKSTLVHLIPRLYDVSEGKVTIDGIDVRDLSFHSLRESVGMVLQKNTLFSGTLRDNLKWGNENATDDEIKAAAKAAQIDTFIESLPEGYDTRVEQGGTNFSGGQKQRLCIARAMLKHPAILVLDDSTSAVDTATERHIRESFSVQLKDTTTIIIAQRISSVMDADKILVLDDGKLVAEGTHDELLKSSPEYREIYYSQVDEKEAI